MTKEELNLVLEALKQCNTYAFAGGLGVRATEHKNAIAVVEEALAQPQRSESSGKPSAWVGLTEQQLNDIENDFWVVISKHVFDAIEAKLKQNNGYVKEKNT